MRLITCRCLLIAASAPALLLLSAPASPASAAFQYLSPRPGARRVSPWNDVVIRPGSVIDARSVRSSVLSVVGSQSGDHAGDLVLSDDSRTLVFKPRRGFSPGETVAVRLGRGVKTAREEDVPALTFAFSISSVDPRRQWRPDRSEPLPEGLPPPASFPGHSRATRFQVSGCDSLPTDMPPFTLLTWNHPEAGEVFIAPFGFDTNGHLMVVDNFGVPIFYREFLGTGRAADFKLQPDGRLTYFLTVKHKFYALDSSYAVVDSFATGNGYVTDQHDLQILPNGHALLMSSDLEPVRMDSVVAGGDPDAIVTGLIVQELDLAKNVVFQWRSWDHFQITDATPDISLTAPLVDYCHGNAVEPDTDGNLLLSSRNMNEITKIDRQTGAILWRLGLHAANNQFTFVNDTRGFSHQHDIRRLPNGHITLFDNGNYLSPIYSKADEYELDEQAKTATLVWEYRDFPDAVSGIMGNVQRRASGGTMIGWGGRAVGPKLTDLRADGTKTYELGFEGYTISYRSFRFPWRTNRLATSVDTLDFGDVDYDQSASLPLTVTNRSAFEITISCVVTADPAFSAQAETPIVLAPDSSATVTVSFSPLYAGETLGRLYLREIHATELIAQTVELRGSSSTALAVSAPDAGALRLETGRPNPFHDRTTIGYLLPSPGRVRLRIFDVHGREVAALADGFQSAGRHQRSWAAHRLPSGVYFCVLQAGRRLETRKLILMQ